MLAIYNYAYINKSVQICRVYCKYHYLEGHESEDFEVEIFKFLVNLSKNKIDITKKQYGDETQNVPFNIESKYPNIRM